MAFTTKALSFFYKRLGVTGSQVGSTTAGYLLSADYDGYDWWDSSSTNVYSSFLNYPTDSGTSSYLTTRDSASNAAFRALPWGSHACDFLWNVTVPVWRWIINQNTNPGYPGSQAYRYSKEIMWSSSYEASSFHKTYFPGGSSYGVSSYPVTSSWIMFDAKLPTQISYIVGEADSQPVPTQYRGFIGNYPRPNPAPGPGFQAPDTSDQIAYDITYPNISGKATSSIDSQYFDVGTGAAIAQTDVIDNWASVDLNYSDNTPTGLNNTTTALKNLRLFFPTPVSGSGTTGGTDYWFKYFTGYAASEIFTENGGIYNVQFTLKSYPSNYAPASGDRLRIFIHNVVPQVPSSSARIPGADGWYPPDSNIVSIGNGWNGTPILSFNDPQTGYKIEKFNFNLVQYGYPAQFCIEPSGSFGCIVSDIEICKIGVTTDPRFIKPTTITQNTVNEAPSEVAIVVLEPITPGDA